MSFIDIKRKHGSIFHETRGKLAHFLLQSIERGDSSGYSHPTFSILKKEVKKVRSSNKKKDWIPIAMLIVLVLVTVLLGCTDTNSEQSLTKTSFEFFSPLLVAMFSKLLLARDEH